MDGRTSLVVVHEQGQRTARAAGPQRVAVEAHRRRAGGGERQAQEGRLRDPLEVDEQELDREGLEPSIAGQRTEDARDARSGALRRRRR